MLSTATPAYDPDGLWPDMQVALSALAEVEARFEADCAVLAGWDGDERLRRRLIAQAEARRAQDREPLVRQIAELYQTRMNARFFLDADKPASLPSERGSRC